MVQEQARATRARCHSMSARASPGGSSELQASQPHLASELKGHAQACIAAWGQVRVCELPEQGRERVSATWTLASLWAQVQPDAIIFWQACSRPRSAL